MAQTLLKLTAPGVPDLYQGDELVTLSLVDPDNRRQVDWGRRRALLDDLLAPERAGAVHAVLVADEGPQARDLEKLALVVRALRLRRDRPDVFAGSYEPLDAGPDVCAYLRGGEVLVIAVLREAGQRAVIDGWGCVAEHTAGRSYALVAR
jgi:(1->4)-alpha-D-glucan 1-alpha-D-glucosylmutase